MTHEVARRLTAVAATGGLLLLASCTSSTDLASTPSPARATATTSSVPATSSPTSATTSGTPGVPKPGSMDKPASSSGSLSKRSFPTPRQLGAGWRYSVDPGSAEEGYAGNGTPALARDPREVVRTAVPLGCARHSPMPTPRHALEVDYRLRGATVIAVRGRFDDSGQARRFFAARAANLTACAGRRGSVAIGPLVARISTPAPQAITNDRTPNSDPWRELAIRDGDTVALLAVQGRDPLSPSQTRGLVRLFRS